jgi:hypothetical protein
VIFAGLFIKKKYNNKKKKKKGGDENTNKYIYLYTTINQLVKHGKGEINK